MTRLAGPAPSRPTLPAAGRHRYTSRAGVAPAVVLLLLAGCFGGGGGQPPQPPEPPYTEACQALLDQGLPWCHEAIPSMSCGECVHNPNMDPKHCEKAAPCPVEPPPVDPPPVDPPAEGCSFPQGVPNSDFTMGPVLTEYAATVNTAMKEITGCDIGTDCPTGMTPDDWMHAVIEKIKLTGLCAGRHVDTTPGGTDEIAVAAKCTDPWEGYKIYNYGGGKVIWSPNANRPSWTITPGHCSGGPVEPPPVGDCPLPHPDLTRMKFKAVEHNGILDTSWTTVNQEPYCREIGMSPMADGTLRAGCPVRPEGGEGSEERAPCEAELCDQKWECNGQSYPPYKGNAAQSNCRGHWKTWCSAEGSTAVLEGDR